MMRHTAWLAAGLALAGAAVAQQAPHGQHGMAAAVAAFRANVLLETPLLGTEDRIYRLYTIDLGPGGATPRHYHPGDEIALVLEGAVQLELEGQATRSFSAGQTFHPLPMTPHVARNASATQPARLMVSSITEAGKPTTVLVSQGR